MVAIRTCPRSVCKSSSCWLRSLGWGKALTSSYPFVRWLIASEYAERLTACRPAKRKYSTAFVVLSVRL